MSDARGDEPYFLDEPRRRAEETQAELKRVLREMEEDQRRMHESLRELNKLFYSTHTGT